MNLEKQKIIHKLLEQKYKKQKFFSRHSENMFSFKLENCIEADACDIVFGIEIDYKGKDKDIDDKIWYGSSDGIVFSAYIAKVEQYVLEKYFNEP